MAKKIPAKKNKTSRRNGSTSAGGFTVEQRTELRRDHRGGRKERRVVRITKDPKTPASAPPADRGEPKPTDTSLAPKR